MPTYNDGDVPYGAPPSALLTSVPGGSFLRTYVVLSVTFDEAAEIIERRDGANVMSGRSVIDDSAAPNLGLTGSARLRRATANNLAPQIGNGLAFAGLGLPLAAQQFVVTGMTQAAAQADAQTFEVRFASRTV